jgi:hypothetical protein
MRQLLLPLVLLLLWARPADAQETLDLQPSDQARFTLVTVGPGDELYSCFGHSALRLYDPGKGMDIAFNYGTFDFNTPNFALRFAKGNLPYMLSIQYTASLAEGAMLEKRYVYERELRLSAQQVKKVAAFLQENYRPQNRTYAYNFFADNCATRLRDVLVKALGSEVRWDTAHGRPSSFRKLFNHYSRVQPWADFGMNIGLGLPADRRAGSWEAAFLPDSLDALFARAQVQNASTGQWQPLVQPRRDILNYAERQAHGYGTPMIVFMIMALVVIIVSALQRLGKLPHALHLLNSPWWDRLLFGTVGLLGTVMLLLWFATDHHDTAWNPNLLWAMPTHLVLAFCIGAAAKWRKALSLYLIIAICFACICLVLALATSYLHGAVAWLALLLLARLGMVLRGLQMA